MTSKSKFRPSPAMAISCVALFLALVGTAFAAPKLAVRSAQIVDATIRTVDLRDNAVSSAKIADATVTAADLGTDSVGADEIAENAVASPEVAPDSLTAADLGAASVASSEVADQSLTQDDVGPNAVGSSEIQAGAIRSSELGPIVQVTNSTPIKAGDNAVVTASCPAGTTVISGGGLPGLYAVALVGSLRSGNGWAAYAHSNSANDTTLTAYAYCLTGGSSN
jgi:hypothetical protein